MLGQCVQIRLADTFLHGRGFLQNILKLYQRRQYPVVFPFLAAPGSFRRYCFFLHFMAGDDRAIDPGLIKDRCQHRKNRSPVPLKKQGIVLALFKDPLPCLFSDHRSRLTDVFPLQLLFCFPDHILHQRIDRRDHAISVQTDHTTVRVIQKGFQLRRGLFLHIHSIFHVFCRGESLTHGILCHGKEEGRYSRLRCNRNCRIAADHHIRALGNSPAHGHRKLRPLIREVGLQLNVIKLVEIRHIAEHITEANHCNHRLFLSGNLLRTHDKKRHLLRSQNNLNYRCVGILLDDGCLQAAGNDDGCPVRNGSACLHNRIPGVDHPHFLDLKFFLLQNVMGLVDHLLPGHQKCYFSHAFSSLSKYAATPCTAGGIFLLLLFDIP